jgi:hypothetical protein
MRKVPFKNVLRKLNILFFELRLQNIYYIYCFKSLEL